MFEDCAMTDLSTQQKIDDFLNKLKWENEVLTEKDLDNLQEPLEFFYNSIRLTENK